MTTFTDLKLSAPLLQALATEGYEIPTPIQAQAIPSLLEGRDLLGIAQTGTGKTAAFALPLLQRLTTTERRAGPRSVRALILTPTRELCVQILDSFRTYGRHLRLSRAAVYGGVSQGPQVHNLARGVDVLVATPGRLLDLMNQGQVKFDSLEAFVLDEADRMLDMGFIVPVKRIVAKLPKERQTLLFSATMPQAVHGLVASLLKEPVRVEVTPVATTAERIAQRVHFVEKANKRALLESLLKNSAISRALVFTRTKHGANKVAEQLARAGVRADAIHGNKSQNARQKALEDFRNGKVRVLVATDIAARGIDVDGISHVINFDLPNEPESYVHRIGRTARAGNEGIAISFCDSEERTFLRDIEKTIRQQVPVDADHPFHAAHIAEGGRAGGGQSRGRKSEEGRKNGGHSRAAAHAHGNHPKRRPTREAHGEGAERAHGHSRQSERQPAAQEHNRDAQNRRHEPRGEARSETRGDSRGTRHAGQATRGHGQDHGQGHSRGQPRDHGQSRDHGQARDHGQGRDRNQGRSQGHQAKPAHATGAKGGERPLHRSRGGQGANGQKAQRFEPVRMD
jgi:ATP-dependent RNA helicase RhlE